MNYSTRLALDIVTNAQIHPVSDFDIQARTFRCGVLDNDNVFCELSKHIKAGYENVSPTPSQTSLVLKGTYIFGGFLQNRHFGHFLIESLCRLWASEFFPNVRSILFVKRSPEAEVAPFVNNVLKHIVPNAEIRIIDEVTLVETLIVPQPTCDPSQGILLAHSQNERLFSSLRAKFIDEKKNVPTKIYVSRSELPSNHGLLVGEKLLEKKLKLEGYTIIHPEKLSIEEQFHYYTNAEKLIFADGSAFHLYVLVATTKQKIYIVWRRQPHGTFSLQSKSFNNQPLNSTPHIAGYFNSRDEVFNSARQKALIDVDSLSNELFKLDFIEQTWVSEKELEKEKINYQEQNYVFTKNN